MSFIDLVISAASERGTKGTERVLTRLCSLAATEGHKAPKPADIIGSLPAVTRKGQDSTPEVEPLVFVYALYLMVEYGYEVKDARRIANRFRTELDGYMVEGSVLQTKTNITNAELAFDSDREDTSIERKIATLTSSVKSFRKMIADGKALSSDDELAIANLVSDLQTLITHTSRVEALV